MRMLDSAFMSAGSQLALIRFATCAYQQLVRTAAAASFDSTGDLGSANQVVEQLSGRHVLHVSSDLGLLRLFRGRPKWIPEVEVEVGGGGGFWTGAHVSGLVVVTATPKGCARFAIVLFHQLGLMVVVVTAASEPIVVCNRVIPPTRSGGGAW